MKRLSKDELASIHAEHEKWLAYTSTGRQAFFGEGIVIAMSSPTEQERDNYSLLKAAPELLEALQERISADRCESPIRKPLPNPRGFLAQDELLDCGSCGYCKARAAIAKATQEAPNASSS